MATRAEATTCTGVLLAGGRSSRMGRDKALLEWRGRTLIEHQLELLRHAGLDAVRVSGRRPDYDGIVDPVADAGPLGGLAGIAAALDDGDLLVVPIDMPRLDADLLRRLRDAAATTGCVRYASRILPMRLRLDATVRTAIDALMAAPDKRSRSLRALQERIGITILPLDPGDAAKFADCNTPADWQETAP